jgi:hypothetical protein
MGTGVLSSKIKRPGREVGRSSQSRTEVKKEWRYPPIYLHGVDRDNFSFI